MDTFNLNLAEIVVDTVPVYRKADIFHILSPIGELRTFADGHTEFFSNAQLAEEAKQIKAAAEAATLQAKLDQAYAEGTAAGKKKGVRAAANISPSLRSAARQTATEAAADIKTADQSIQKALVIKTEKQADLDDANVVLENLHS